MPNSEKFPRSASNEEVAPEPESADIDEQWAPSGGFKNFVDPARETGEIPTGDDGVADITPDAPDSVGTEGNTGPFHTDEGDHPGTFHARGVESEEEIRKRDIWSGGYDL